MPRFYIYTPFDGAPATAGNGTMVAFEAPSNAAVDRAYGAGLSSGGSDAGEPGPRLHYGEGYYGAYLRDPDGSKVHVVHRGICDDRWRAGSDVKLRDAADERRLPVGPIGQDLECGRAE